MRYLERSILLQVIDNRWREHLFDMDYLREGIHLRGFAQIDPLVAYKNEGYIDVRGADALDLGRVQQTGLPRRSRSPAGPGQRRRGRRRERRPTALDYSGGTAEAQPSALRAGRGRRCGRRRRGRRRAGLGRRATAAPTWSRPWSRTSTTKSAATTPAGVAVGQEVQEVPRGLSDPLQTGASRGPRSLGSCRRSPAAPCVLDLLGFRALDMTIQSGSSSGRSTSAISTRSSRCSIPRSSCTLAGLRKGIEAARVWATREPGGVQQTIELEQLYEDGTEGGGGRAVALIVRALALGRERRAGRRRRDGLGLRAARPPGPQLAALRGPRRGAARRPGSAPGNLRCMADAAPTEAVAPRLAAVREQLSLLSDYL